MLFRSDDEKRVLLQDEPHAEKWIRPFLGGQEFLNNIPRWCLWLVGIAPNELRAMPHVLQRVEEVKKARLASNYACSIGSVDRPTEFERIRQPSTSYLAVPEVSSENRRFVPIGFLGATIIASNKLYTISDAGLYEFGILSCTMHNAWMRAVCGRLESRYQYSPGIVYNNFPWPDEPTDKQRTTIEAAAQAVLDARAQFPQSSLADLYDPLTMPPALVKAHQALDRAVDACYRKVAFTSDAQRVEFLFERYQQLTSLLPTDAIKTKRRKKIEL